MKKIRIGLAGGGVQHGAHMMAYTEMPNVEISAVCALPEDVKRFAERWGIKKTYTDLEKLCNDPEIDIIDIALPNYLHCKTVILAAEAGKAVFCEKPLALNAEEAKKMVATVEKHSVFSAYLENYTFLPWAEEAKRCIDAGVLGKPVWCRAGGGGLGAYSSWFFKPELAGGGCFIDVGCHFVEMQRYLLGKKNPAEAFGWTASLVNKNYIEGGVEDYCLAMMKYHDDVMCEVEVSAGFVSGGEGFKLYIAGTEGTFTSDTFPNLKIFSIAKDTQPLRGFRAVPGVEKGWFLFGGGVEGMRQAMLSQMKHVTECYLEDKEPRHTFKDGMIVNKIIDTIYKSAKTKKWERIDL
jgi:predicted dehydrogenase